MTDLWEIETRFWLEGAAAYEELMARQCVMVFEPMGIMHRDGILEGLRNSPRWSTVKLSKQSEVLHDHVAILAYQASAKREGGEDYKALCTSTYLQEAGEWRLVQHQQTPAVS